MRHRYISVIPSYLMVVVVMVIIGVLASGVVANVFLPLGRQEGYTVTDVDYTVDIGGGKVVVQIANKKPYDVKLDVVLLTHDNRVLTACPSGYIKGSTNIAGVEDGGFSLLGLRVRGYEIITIVCYVSDIRDVRIYGYGVSEIGEKERAHIGSLSSIYLESEVYNIGDVWKGVSGGFQYRLPVTVVATKTYSPAYVAVKLSSQTLPIDIWRFFKSHVNHDLSDILVTDVNGRDYPTRAVRGSDGSITVYFKVGSLEPGVHRFYIYFGNPYLENPVHPLEDNIPSRRLISTPTSLPHTIKSSIAYPAYMVPEANWLPKSSELRFGLIYTRSEGELEGYVNIIRDGDVGQVRQVIQKAMGNKVYFPVGTFGARRWRSYWNLYPKTDMKWAPWGIMVAVPLPRINDIPSLTGVEAKLWVSSDDGSGAYIVALRQDRVYRRNIYWNLYAPHAPGYWRYGEKTVRMGRDMVIGSDMYLVIFVQNGICYWRRCGGGPGYLDFRLILQYIEKSGRGHSDRDEEKQPVTGELEIDLGTKTVSRSNRIAEFEYNVQQYEFKEARLVVRFESKGDRYRRYYIISTKRPRQVFWDPWSPYIARGTVSGSETVVVDVTDIVKNSGIGVFYAGVSTSVGSWTISVKLILKG